MPLKDICHGLEKYCNSHDEMVEHLSTDLYIAFADDAEDVSIPEFYKFYADVLERWRLALMSDGELVVVKNLRLPFPWYRFSALLLLLAGMIVVISGKPLSIGLIVCLWLIVGLGVSWVSAICDKDRKQTDSQKEQQAALKRNELLTPFQHYLTMAQLTRQLGFRKQRRFPYPQLPTEPLTATREEQPIKWTFRLLLILGWPCAIPIILLLWGLNDETVYDVRMMTANKTDAESDNASRKEFRIWVSIAVVWIAAIINWLMPRNAPVFMVTVAGIIYLGAIIILPLLLILGLKYCPPARRMKILTCGLSGQTAALALPIGAFLR